VQYSNDWDGLFPAVPGVVKSASTTQGVAPQGSGEESLGILFDVYIPDADIFRCPSAPPRDRKYGPASGFESGARNPSFRRYDLTSYAYDPRHHSAHKPGGALAADSGGGDGVNSPNHHGRGQNGLYLDGHVKWMTRTDVGYADDEIYVRNNNLADPRTDSWVINSRTHKPRPVSVRDDEETDTREEEPPVAEEPEPEPKPKPKPKPGAVSEPEAGPGSLMLFLVPLSIVLAGGLIALAIVMRPSRKE